MLYYLKKIIFALIMIISILSISTTALCQQYSFIIDEAVLTEAGTIKITASSANLCADSKAVIMVTGYSTTPIYSEGSIVYFNTTDIKADEEGKVHFDITPAQWFGEEHRVYAVILSTEHTTKEVFILNLDSGEKPVVYYGDVNMDAVADEADIELIMQYVLNSSTEVIDSTRINRADVIRDGIITATDAAAIAKTLN